MWLQQVLLRLTESGTAPPIDDKPEAEEEDDEPEEPTTTSFPPPPGPIRPPLRHRPAPTMMRPAHLPPLRRLNERLVTFHWRRMVSRAAYRRKWATQGLALKFSLQMPKQLGHRAPTGLTMQGQRWGWREVRNGLL